LYVGFIMSLSIRMEPLFFVCRFHNEFVN